MLLRSFKAVESAGQVVSISHGNSTAVRVLVKSDGLGFSLSEARCGAGKSSDLWYQNHWEANYVRAGSGHLTDRSTGQSWELTPGTMYCVGPNDKHTVSNSSDPLRIISIFNPPIEGDESHDANGAYPATGDLPERSEPMFVRTLDQVRESGNEKSLGDGSITANRILTSADGLGFSFSIVTVKAGARQKLWYKNHWEANLILDGKAVITDHNDGRDHPLGPMDVYCVGPKDPHTLSTETDFQILAIFNPPLTGDEKHDSDGAYPPTGPIPTGPVN